MTRTVLCVSPHPDDELIGAPATLMALRDAGWRVVDLACSLGRPADRARRRAELVSACRLAGFEFVIPKELPPLGAGDDLESARRSLAAMIGAGLDDLEAEAVVGPSPHDGHPAHEVVGRAICDAVEARATPRHAMFWGLWADLPLPNVLVPFDAARLDAIQSALAAHAGELARNRFDRLLRSRAAANAVLGPERVFGFGASGLGLPYAELLTDAAWSGGGGWRLTAPRELDAQSPLGEEGGPEIAWWLHAPSVRSLLRARG